MNVEIFKWNGMIIILFVDIIYIQTFGLVLEWILNRIKMLHIRMNMENQLLTSHCSSLGNSLETGASFSPFSFVSFCSPFIWAFCSGIYMNINRRPQQNYFI